MSEDSGQWIRNIPNSSLRQFLSELMKAISIEGDYVPVLKLKDAEIPLEEYRISRNDVELLLLKSGVAKKLKSEELDRAIFFLQHELNARLRKMVERGKAEDELIRLSKWIRVSDREEIIYSLTKLVEENFNLVNIHENLECYENGVYVECEERITKFIEIRAGELGLGRKTLRFIVNEVIAKLKRRHWVNPKELMIYKYVLAFTNGLFNIKDFIEEGLVRIEEFNSSIYVVHKIPHRLEDLNDFMVKEYGLEPYVKKEINILDLAEKITPFYYKVFREWVNDDDSTKLLYEILGYCFYPAYPIHRAFMIVGEGSNGKSTYLNLIREVIGWDNVTSLTIYDLTENRFGPANLYRKLANIFPDLPKRPLRNTGIFKALTGEDEITADRKFKPPLRFVNYAKLIFSANELPQVSDQTHAFWRRWVIVEFPNKFSENPQFKKEVLYSKEINNLIVVSLYALRNVLIRNNFSVKAECKEKWLRKSNPVFDFIKTMLEEGLLDECKECKVETSELYIMYTTWCNENDIDALRKRDFTIELERLGYKKVVIHGKPYYKGLRKVDRKQLELSTG